MKRSTLISVFGCLVALIWLSNTVVLAQNKVNPPVIQYQLSMTKPQTHYFEVEMQVSEIQDPALKKQGYLDFKMPVWTPGSYLIREYAKNVEGFEASTGGVKIKSEKLNKNTWRVFQNAASAVTIKYIVYAYELSVRTSFLDESHGYLNGASIFMFLSPFKDTPATVTIKPYPAWQVVSTGLSARAGEKFVYDIPNFDILVDSPIEIGNHKVLQFNALNVTHYVAMYGEVLYDEARLLKDMKKVVETASTVVGEHPCKDYTFLVHNILAGGGGLEHLNSTSLQVSRNAFRQETTYLSFLSLVAHEYFHLWNVKRIRPKALGPFDYENENYTHLLWVAEGITTFYQSYILRRAGLYSPEQYLTNFSTSISGIENTPGQRVQSLAESSWDAWIKYYRQNENSKNSLISYYDKGAVIGAMLNLSILSSTNGQKSLDDVLRYLWEEYYKKQKRGFTDEEMQKAVEFVAGRSMEDFFQKYVWGTTPIDYNAFLQPVGCQLVDASNTREAYLGADTKVTEGKLSVSLVFRDSPAYNDGLNVNDEILALDDVRVTANTEIFSRLISSKKPNDKVKFTIIRDGLVKNVEVTLTSNPNKTLKVQRLSSVTGEQDKLYRRWLYIDNQ